ncbi:hypothetical protein VCR12J2_640203 [Vibrio coralliirubri]|nr:hypothetical protein VCR12J2_640203 [Vibrio coralliirubri]
MFNGSYLINQCNILHLEVLSLKYREMSKNYIFRELECQMTRLLNCVLKLREQSQDGMRAIQYHLNVKGL